jgi:hypothetical protein
VLWPWRFCSEPMSPAPQIARVVPLKAQAIRKVKPVSQMGRVPKAISTDKSAWLLLSVCVTIGKGKDAEMANLTIEIPDDLVRSLEGTAAAQRKSVQQLVLEQLSSLVGGLAPPAGSPAAVLRVMQEPPHPSSADVDELDAAILAGRLAVRSRDLFSTDPS